mgnify:FL=1
MKIFRVLLQDSTSRDIRAENIMAAIREWGIDEHLLSNISSVTEIQLCKKSGFGQQCARESGHVAWCSNKLYEWIADTPATGITKTRTFRIIDKEI